MMPAQQEYRDDVELRIKLVENNLCSEIQVEGEPNWTLEERMRFYHVHGVSIAVIKDHKVDWAKGYGWADAGERRAATTSTLFQAGSMSKSVHAVGILKLAQDGRLDLDDDINKYLATWKFPYDSVSLGGKITTANLLSHTAGLTVHGFPGYEMGTPLPTVPQILDGMSPANTGAVRSAFRPSLKGEYSGGGILISQLLVQDITHMPYDRYMWEYVLKPLEMTNSTFSQPPPRTKYTQLATGYYADGTEVRGKYHIYPEQAAAGLWTTPTELAQFIIDIQLSLLGKSNTVLSQQSTETMLTPYKNKLFALGVFIVTVGGQVYFYHSGQDRGFVGRYFGSLQGGTGVVVMANTDDVPIVNEIINSVASVYRWRDFYRPIMTLRSMILEDRVLESYAGQYKNTATSEGQFKLVPGSLLIVTREGHHLKAQAAGQEAIDIYPAEKNLFFPKTSDTDIRFIEDDEGLVTKLTIQQNGEHFQCDKMR